MDGVYCVGVGVSSPLKVIVSTHKALNHNSKILKENKEYIELRKTEPSPLKKLEFMLNEKIDTIATVGGVLIQNATKPLAYAVSCYHCIAPKFNTLTYTSKGEHDHLMRCYECNDKKKTDFRILDDLHVEIEGKFYGIGEKILCQYDTQFDIALIPIPKLKIEKNSIKKIPLHHDSIDSLDIDLDVKPIPVSKWGVKTKSTTGSLIKKDAKYIYDGVSFEDQYLVDNKSKFSTNGDSGAFIVCTTEKGHPYPFGLIHACTETESLAFDYRDFIDYHSFAIDEEPKNELEQNQSEQITTSDLSLTSVGDNPLYYLYKFNSVLKQ